MEQVNLTFCGLRPRRRKQDGIDEMLEWLPHKLILELESFACILKANHRWTSTWCSCKLGCSSSIWDDSSCQANKNCIHEHHGLQKNGLLFVTWFCRGRWPKNTEQWSFPYGKECHIPLWWKMLWIYLRTYHIFSFPEVRFVISI